MKRTLTALLCAMVVLVAREGRSQETNSVYEKLVQPEVTEANPKPKVIWIICAILGALAAGGYIIFKVHQCTNIPQHSEVTIVLEKSYDYATWTPVFTNKVTLNGTQPIEFFRERMTDDLAFYRAHLLRD